MQSTSASLDDLPVTSRSGARFLLAEAQLGAEIPGAPGLALLAGAARRAWGRDIRGALVTSRAGESSPVEGLSEVYSWYELQGGARWTVVVGGPVALSVEARVTRSVAPRMVVDWMGRDVQLRLGGRTGFRVATDLRVALGPVLFARTGAWLEAYAFGASAADPTYRIHEPKSTTRTGALELGAGARF